MTERSDLVPSSGKGIVSVRGPAGQQQAHWYLKQREFNAGDWL